jgi:polyhydroxyalkanoate synthase
MTASKRRSTSSHTETPPSGEQQAQASPADMQRMFESWLGAWRSFADPTKWPLAAQAAPMNGMAAQATNGQASGSPFSFPFPFAMPQMPPGGFPGMAMPSMANAQQALAGMQLPVASVPPDRLRRLQADYSRECLALLQQASATDKAPPDLPDRRFSADAWKATPAFAYMAAWYLLNARYLQALADALDTDAKTRERIRFAVQQWTAAASPSNFLALNPDAQKALLDSHGESLRQGVMNLLTDMRRGKISQSDESRFVVGKNIGATEGAVIFENELIQLIQYKPRTPSVFERPLLMVPPCINKFYILDLQPESSLVAHALEAGHQVFMISWRNVDASLAGKSWDDYLNDGVLAAIDIVKSVSGREQINTFGFCIGGTMISTALAVLAARGEHPAASMTLLTAMLDFSDTGVLDVFVDEAHVRMREQTIGGLNGAAPALMRGVEFANAFSFLRPNDLVWNYVVDNYLKGRTPAPFDLLYWNGDSTNLPGPMYVWYLRNTYLENRLREPGALTVCGESLDLSRIDVPTFIYGSRDDHIVPWRTAYASAPLLTGPKRFVLGASGHIAGVINPPAKGKRSYWTQEGNEKALPDNPDDWFETATEKPGSWWPEWIKWLDQYGGKTVKARAQLGSAEYPVIEPAPGRYVQERD